MGLVGVGMGGTINPLQLLMESRTMSVVEIRDHAIWIKHIHGNETLKDRLMELDAGELVTLNVHGYEGIWKKMDDGKDGRPTPGIKALGNAKVHWHDLQDSRGEMVEINEV